MYDARSPAEEGGLPLTLTRTADDYRVLNPTPEAVAYLARLPHPLSSRRLLGRSTVWAKKDGSMWTVSKAAASRLAAIMRGSE